MPYKKKKVKLQHYKTREIIQANSIFELCQRTGLKQPHVSNVLNKREYHHKGWHLPCNKKYTVCDVNGNKYQIDNLLLFCKKYHLQINGMIKLINKEVISNCGLFLSETEGPVRKKKNIFVFKKGNKIIKVKRIIGFANQLKCSYQAVQSVTQGLGKSVKGWKLIDIEQGYYGKKLLNNK